MFYLKNIFFVIGLLLMSIIIIIFLRNLYLSKSKHQNVFSKGIVPNGAINGLYDGSIGVNVSWKGKKFDSINKSGINVFENDSQKSEDYPFFTYVDFGVTDKNQKVLKIDY